MKEKEEIEDIMRKKLIEADKEIEESNSTRRRRDKEWKYGDSCRKR